MSAIQRKLQQQKYNNVTLKNKKNPITNSQNGSNNTDNVKLSKSYPNINAQTNRSSLLRSMRISKSDTNIAQTNYKIAQKTDSNYMHTKSEVCLRTITIRNTSPEASGNNTVRERRENRDILNEQRRLSTRSEDRTRPSSRGSFTNSNYEPIINTSCIRVPIIGYEVMEERARFTVNCNTFF